LHHFDIGPQPQNKYSGEKERKNYESILSFLPVDGFAFVVSETGKEPHRIGSFLCRPQKRFGVNPDGGKNLANSSRQFAASANRRFQFHKRSQVFIRPHNETLPVVAMCVSNPAAVGLPSERSGGLVRLKPKTIPLSKCRMIRHNSRRDSVFIGRLRGKRPD
jgi:hypothetical protein